MNEKCKEAISKIQKEYIETLLRDQGLDPLKDFLDRWKQRVEPTPMEAGLELGLASTLAH